MIAVGLAFSFFAGMFVKFVGKIDGSISFKERSFDWSVS